MRPDEIAPPVPTLDALAQARATGRALVVAQLGQSLDGRIATETGHSHYINGNAAIVMLHRLRAAVDAVVVGAGTAAADDPQLTVRHCAGANPARVLIDRRRRAGSRRKMLAADGARRVVVGPRLQDDPAGIEYLDAGDVGSLDPARLVAQLHGLGFHRLLIEGGAVTVSGFIAAGAVSRLCVAVAPLIIGAGPVGLGLPPVSRLDDAIRPHTQIVCLPGGDVVFDCDLTRTQA